MIFTIIASILGIISSFVAWKFNPRRVIYSQIDQTYKELDALYVKRDKALATNDTDILTAITDDYIRLRTRQNELLQRIGSSSI